MATLRIIIRPEHKRSDDTYPISIRLTHSRSIVHISTGVYASKSQLTKSFEIKDTKLLTIMLNRIEKYKGIIDELSLEISNYTARELADYVIEKAKPNKGLDSDFLELATKHANEVKSAGRTGSATNYFSAINALRDFSTGYTLTIKSISYKFLDDFSKHLKTERVITRKNQLGKSVTTINKPLSELSINNYIRDIRTLYNVIVLNMDEELMNEALIKYNPFRKFKVQQPKVTSSQRTISVDELQRIFAYCPPEESDRRVILGRDVYLLSFLLVGMNSVDLWNVPKSAYKDGRITYNRMKTKGRRADEALISIKVEPEAIPFIEKYISEGDDKLFSFSKQYSTAANFNKAINIGLSKFADMVEIESKLTFYTARHTWATIARNKCRISKDDVHLALNHSDSKMNITDRYIERCWDFVDEANRKVIDYVMNE